MYRMTGHKKRKMRIKKNRMRPIETETEQIEETKTKVEKTKKIPAKKIVKKNKKA